MTLSAATRQAAFLQETDEVFLVLVTIAHADISPSIRVVNNTERITSNGNEFAAFPFDVELPDSREAGTSRARLTIDNVSREIAESIRMIATAATVLLEVIRAADPDTIEKTWSVLTLKNVKWDMFKMSGDLILEEIDIEPYPAGQFSPASFPGLF